MTQFDMYRNAQYPLTGYGKDWSMGGGAFSAQVAVFHEKPEFKQAIWRLVWKPSPPIKDHWWSKERFETGHIRLMSALPGPSDKQVIMEISSDKQSPISSQFIVTDHIEARQYFIEGKGAPEVYSSSLELVFN
jgi:hypothetical protein